MEEIVNKRKNCCEKKFESYFKKYKKVIVINEEGRKEVENYKEFLESFSSEPYEILEELEEFLISFIKCIAIISDVKIELFYNSDGIKKESNTERIKRVYLDDFESINNVLEELRIARVLAVY
ncbi:MAG: hypothetical protein E6526_16395 [Clostridium sp.]|nr:hypothetical protein [Clostridium sp.]